VGLDRPAPPPDQPTPDRSADHPAPPPPDDPWNVANLTRAQAFESLRAEAAAQDSSAPLADQPRDYWNEVGAFQSAWEKITERFPTRPETVEAVAPDRRADERDEQRMALEKVSDREPAVSADIKRVETDAGCGGRLLGFDFRLKAADRLTEKVAERLRREPDRDPERILGTIHDAIRYTFCLPQDSYTAGCEEIKGMLESRGYQMYQRKNSWSDSEYKGLNTRWVTPEGQRFEVQFHTPESFHAKHDVTHRAYERLRRPGVDPAERQELMDFQKLVSSYIPVPDRAQEISDFNKDT
jgi:hypothetical protein